MRSRSEFIELIRQHEPELKSKFGIEKVRLFGSTAREEHRENSDVDVFVETQTPNPFLLMDAKEYLEGLLKMPVDVVRNHRNLNSHLRKRIERDGIIVY